MTSFIAYQQILRLGRIEGSTNIEVYYMCDVIFELAIQFVLYRTPKTNIKGKGYKYFRTYTFLRKTVKQEGQDVNKCVIVISFKDYNYNWLLYSPNVKKK